MERLTRLEGKGGILIRGEQRSAGLALKEFWRLPSCDVSDVLFGLLFVLRLV